MKYSFKSSVLAKDVIFTALSIMVNADLHLLDEF